MAPVYYTESEQNINFYGEKFETGRTNEEMERVSWLKHLQFMSRIPLSTEKVENDAFNIGITSKNNKTKVFNGSHKNKTIPSLLKLCVQSLQDNIDDIGFIGRVPFLLLKPVLEKATPEQLHKIETFNPHLIAESDRLWKKHCETKFRNKQRQALEAWKEMFIRCNAEEEARLQYLTEKIRLGQKAKREPIKKTKKIDITTGRSRPIIVKKPVRRCATRANKIKDFENVTSHTTAATHVRLLPLPTRVSQELCVASGTTTASLPGTTSASGPTTAALPGTTSASGTTTATLPGTTSSSGPTTATLPGTTSASGTTTSALPDTTSASSPKAATLPGTTATRTRKPPKKAPLMQKTLRQLKNCRR